MIERPLRLLTCLMHFFHDTGRNVGLLQSDFSPDEGTASQGPSLPGFCCFSAVPGSITLNFFNPTEPSDQGEGVYIEVMALLDSFNHELLKNLFPFSKHTGRKSSVFEK